MAKTEAPMSVMEGIHKRRSVRSYLPEKLDRATILALLDAAVYAPTAIHQEPWSFVVVQDVNLLKRLSDRAKPLLVAEAQRAHLDRGGHRLDIFESPDFNLFHNAGTLIVICGKAMGPYVVADCWLAAENLMLAACAMGLGSCVIGSAVAGLNTAEVKAELGIPPGISVVAPIIVGVPSGDTSSSTHARGTSLRREPEILAWK